MIPICFALSPPTSVYCLKGSPLVSGSLSLSKMSQSSSAHCSRLVRIDLSVEVYAFPVFIDGSMPAALRILPRKFLLAGRDLICVVEPDAQVQVYS